MAYTAIHSEGGLIPLDTLEKIAREAVPGQKPADFDLPKGRRLSDEIARAWSDAQDYWHVFRRRCQDLPENETGTTLTRERWMLRLLLELLGYELAYQPSGAVVEGRTYPISHRAGPGEESPPVHIEGFRVDLDRRPASGHRRLSPQALLQDYLNRSEQHLWGIVTNGLVLRVLRDTSRTSRPTYVQFDLESILEGNRFTEFFLFYRLCHRTRLPKTGDDPHICFLEDYFQLSIEEGGRIRDRLRDGVEEALKILGTGFLRHPENRPLLERVKSNTLKPVDYHRQLLRLVYRLLFLMVAEERGMIVSEGEDAEGKRRIYNRFYSVARLRERAEHIVEKSLYCDLWIGLQQTFKVFSDVPGTNALGIPSLNGELFSESALRDLQGTHLYNYDLLLAIRHLSMFRDRGIPQRVNYRDLDVEELGSVYESLLDFHPTIEKQDEGQIFDLRPGMERKSTGSYYTRPELVAELIESALVPVMQNRLDNAKSTEEKERELLGLKICDPASGSGHFLLAAARRVGRELAKVRTGEEEPTAEEFRLAVRDVIARSVYAVDVNPLAVDLCKLALWLEAHCTGKPLSFLDPQIKLGNSLIGVLDSKVLVEGIPDEAFNPATGDDKKVASAFKTRNREERSAQRSFASESHAKEKLGNYASDFRKLIDFVENTPADVKQKAKMYQKWREREDYCHDWTAANLWTAAFFVRLNSVDDPIVPTHEPFIKYLEHNRNRPQMTGLGNALALERHFFHWYLEFPEVFADGGFDVVLGNPPWERIKLQEEEFFAPRDPEIANAPNKAARQKLINGLENNNPSLLREFMLAKHAAEATSKFVRHSGRFPLTAVGDVNTYALFAELARKLLNPSGRAGVIVPTGIGTDDTCKDFFADLNQNRGLVSLYDFENRERLFDIDSRMKFCLLTMSTEPKDRTDFAFFCTNANHLRDERRRFSLAAEDLGLFNPNTRTCPVFRTRTDAELTKKIYQRVPVLANEKTGENPWGVKFLRMFDMANDSQLFKTAPGKGLLPLYEAKMLHQFDHRWATYDEEEFRDCSEEEKQNPNFKVKPRYWVDQSEVAKRLSGVTLRWLLGFRSLARATDERTAIFGLFPIAAVGNSFIVLRDWKWRAVETAIFLATANSIVFDYVVRQKIGGANFNFFIVNQLPALRPDSFSASAREFIAERVLELVYTAWDMKPFAEDLGYRGEPFKWDQGRRARIRAELDAYYAVLYGLSRDELRYILDPEDVYGDDFPGETFRVLKENEMENFGEYRTRRHVLEAYDELSKSWRTKSSATG